VLKPHGLYLFGYSPKKAAKRAAAVEKSLKISHLV
jgi:ribulose-5-phosphate 4-epimerase/fuculose-1-phosphate aldolase